MLVTMMWQHSRISAAAVADQMPSIVRWFIVTACLYSNSSSSNSINIIVVSIVLLAPSHMVAWDTVSNSYSAMTVYVECVILYHGGKFSTL